MSEDSQESKLGTIRAHLESLPEILLVRPDSDLNLSGIYSGHSDIDLYVAPVNPECDVERLNEFLQYLIPPNLKPDKIINFESRKAEKREDFYLRFGRLYFKEIVGKVITTTRIEKRIVTEDRDILKRKEFGGGIEKSKPIVKERNLVRSIDVNLYPSKEYAQKKYPGFSLYAIRESITGVVNKSK